MEKCLFCDSPPNSDEHVFLSALGGRLLTRHATCQKCNGHFSRPEGGKIDDLLAEQFLHVRCGLAIWSGRNDPPPSIFRVGKLPDGTEFDLAPGFVPLPRASQIPKNLKDGSNIYMSARTVGEARKIIDILEMRGFQTHVKKLEQLRSKAPWLHFDIRLGGADGFRSAGKTAVIGACVLYGNEAARKIVSDSVLQAIYCGSPDIASLAGWDYTNVWPAFSTMTPHPKTPDARPSGFEHTLIIGDVGDSCVAYVEYFGGFRFSIRLGECSRMPAKGLAVNPRSPRSARFLLTPQMPNCYCKRLPDSLKVEFVCASKGLHTALNRVLEKWHMDSHSQHYQELSSELQDRLAIAGDNETDREVILGKWAEEVASIEFGTLWREELDVTDLDEGPAL
jgi:hypothetical protein